MIFTKSTTPVESGIPIPKGDERPRSSAAIFPFDKMKVGDSFSINKDRKYLHRNALARRKTSHPEERYVTRKKKNKNFRCWRVT